MGTDALGAAYDADIEVAAAIAASSVRAGEPKDKGPVGDIPTGHVGLCPAGNRCRIITADANRGYRHVLVAAARQVQNIAHFGIGFEADCSMSRAVAVVA